MDDQKPLDYRTTDLTLAAYLTYQGARIIRVEASPGRPADFVLGGVTDEALEGFANNAPIPIRSYLAAFREAKAALTFAASSRRGGR